MKKVNKATVKVKRKVGKPKGSIAFHPTAEQRDTVCLLRASGMSVAGIAAAMDISAPTLQFHFGQELSVLYKKKRMRQLKNLEKAANKGNITAQRLLLTFFDKGDIDFEDRPLLGRPPKPKDDDAIIVEEKKEKLGKHEGLNLEAKTAHSGTSWENKLQ